MSSDGGFWWMVVVGAIALVVGAVWIYRLIRPGVTIEREPDPSEPVVILDGLSELNAEVYRSKLETMGIMATKRNSHIAPTIEYIPPFGWEVLVRYGDRFAAEECLGMTLLTSETAEDSAALEAE